MKVIQLNNNSAVYSCNVYLVLGDWNRIEDVNALVDGGADGSIVAEIEKLSTGVGKNAVSRVVLTHGHFDHVGGLPAIKQKYNPEIFAFMGIDDMSGFLYDGQIIRLGDRDFEVLHTPGHSQDSICLYCEQERVLFSGDTTLDIKTPGGSYTEEFVDVLEKIARQDIDIIYSGHGRPVTEKAGEMIRNTLVNVRKSHIVQR